MKFEHDITTQCEKLPTRTNAMNDLLDQYGLNWNSTWRNAGLYKKPLTRLPEENRLIIEEDHPFCGDFDSHWRATAESPDLCAIELTKFIDAYVIVPDYDALIAAEIPVNEYTFNTIAINTGAYSIVPVSTVTMKLPGTNTCISGKNIEFLKAVGKSLKSTTIKCETLSLPIFDFTRDKTTGILEPSFIKGLNVRNKNDFENFLKKELTHLYFFQGPTKYFTT